MVKKLVVLSGFIFLFVFGCDHMSSDIDCVPDTDISSDADSDTETENEVSTLISGAIQKGPFASDATLTVVMLDSTGAPTGPSYATVTEDDLGTFNVVADTAGPCELVGNGFYYNEIADKLSGASITLRAVYEILEGDPQEAYLNVFTHMSSGLARKRLSEGDTVSDAVAYAENKLFDELGIIHPLGALEGNGTEMNLTDPSSLDNQWVMALSCIVAKAAELRAVDASEVDARLQELVNDIRGQIQASEAINPEYKEYLRAGESALNPIGDCVDNLADYLYAKTGETVELPDPDQCADNDHDGIPNATDPDIDGDTIPNADDEAPYNGNIGGGMYFDSETGLVWENILSSDELSWPDANTYCEDLALGDYDDWRMPTISELRALIKGCVITELDGACGITDECNYQSCLTDECYIGCPGLQGPGIGGCFWPDFIQGECGEYWSATNNPTYPYLYWVPIFTHAYIIADPISTSDTNYVLHFVRCVRTM